MQHLKKTKKSCFFGFSKKTKKCNHVVMQPLITQLPEIGTGKSRSVTNIKHLAQKCGHKKLCNWELCVINAY